MTIFRKAGEPVPVPSAARAGVTYRLRVPNVYERQAVRRELTRTGARRYGGLATYEQLRAALREILTSSDDSGALTVYEGLVNGQIDALRRLAAAEPSGVATAYAALVEGDRALLRVVTIVQRSPLPAARLYSEMASCNSNYAGLYGIAVARLLLDGIDGDPLAWAPDRPGETPDWVLDRIDDADFDAIGVAFQMVSEVSADTSKNSASPSAGGSVPESSPAAKTQPATTH